MKYNGKALYYDIWLEEVHPLDDYKLLCKLSNGETKMFDFTPMLEWPMFSHLKGDKEEFGKVIVSEDFGAPAWPDPGTNEFDLELGLSWIIQKGDSPNIYRE